MVETLSFKSAWLWNLDCRWKLFQSGEMTVFDSWRSTVYKNSNSKRTWELLQYPYLNSLGRNVSARHNFWTLFYPSFYDAKDFESHANFSQWLPMTMKERRRIIKSWIPLNLSVANVARSVHAASSQLYCRKWNSS